MIERGHNLYLAVVYSGKGASVIKKRVRWVLHQIEAAYAGVLEKWDGDMDKVVGARDLIREYLLKSNGRPFRGLPGLPSPRSSMGPGGISGVAESAWPFEPTT